MVRKTVVVAEAKALPVYRFNPSLQDDQASRLKAAFVQCRALLGLNPTPAPRKKIDAFLL